jgi:hypothetical protein
MNDSSSSTRPVYDIVVNIIAEAYNFLYAYCEYRVEHNMV